MAFSNFFNILYIYTIYEKLHIYKIIFVQILDILFDMWVFFYRIKMPLLTKNQRVWICLEFARTNNSNEVLMIVKAFDTMVPVKQAQRCIAGGSR